MTKKYPENIQFDLINNAKDSLSHAVEHLTVSDNLKPSDIKIAICEISHVVELLLKERLTKTLRALVWEDIDRYPLKDAKTVDLDKAVKRLSNISGIAFKEETYKTICACKKIRNQIEHYEFSIPTKEAKGIIGRLLSFIFEFSEKHLKVDLEKEFRSDDRWKILIDIYEFWEAHAEAIERKLSEQGVPFGECPSCGASTFEYNNLKCHLCEHTENEVVCSSCGNTVWESEADYFKGIEEDGSPLPYVICKSCIEAQTAEDYFVNQAVDEQRENRA